MSNHDCDRVHLRSLYPSPDDPNEFVCSTNSGCILPLKVNDCVSVQEESPEAPWVRLPSPVLDLVWCPFRRGEDNASYLTACTGQPVQLWDTDDASVRATYTACNDSGIHSHPFSLAWSSRNQFRSIAAGYGGFEDKKHVRFFDLLIEGDAAVSSYTSHHSKGVVAALEVGPEGPGGDLYAAGFRGSRVVDVIDRRGSCPAALLAGATTSIDCIRRNASEPFLLYGGSTRGDGRVLCWDLRRPATPLRSFARHLDTFQHHNFQLFSSSPSAHTLVAAGGREGVLVYHYEEGTAGEVACTKTVAATDYVNSVSLLQGITDVVALLGQRVFTHPHDVERPCGELEYVPPAARKRSRPTVSLTDEEKEEGGDVASSRFFSQSCTTTTPNATVISIK